MQCGDGEWKEREEGEVAGFVGPITVGGDVEVVVGVPADSAGARRAHGGFDLWLVVGGEGDFVGLRGEEMRASGKGQQKHDAPGEHQGEDAGEARGCELRGSRRGGRGCGHEGWGGLYGQAVRRSIGLSVDQSAGERRMEESTERLDFQKRWASAQAPAGMRMAASMAAEAAQAVREMVAFRNPAFWGRRAVRIPIGVPLSPLKVALGACY